MLIYRFPNQEIIKKNGGFAKIKTFPKNGFVIQKFKGSDAYVFEEDDLRKLQKKIYRSRTGQ